MNYVLISGAAKRLGADIALYLARCGHNIAIHYRSSEKEAKEIALKVMDLGKKAVLVQGDFSTRKGVRQFIRRCPLSEIRSFIHNVGNFHKGSLSRTDEEVYYELFQVNLHAAFEVSKALLPSIKKRKGTLIYVGIAELETGGADTFATVYQITKSALWLMMRSFAKELVGDGVTVNMVSPGYLQGSVILPKEEGSIVAYEDISKMIAFLIENRSLTGQNIAIARGVRL